MQTRRGFLGKLAAAIPAVAAASAITKADEPMTDSSGIDWPRNFAEACEKAAS